MMKSSRVLTAVLAMLLLCTPLAAQETTVVSGIVTTVQDGLPVPGAMVAIPSLNLSSTTDAEGRYSITVPARAGDRVEVRATFSGLRTATATVTLTPGAVTQDFPMT